MADRFRMFAKNKVYQVDLKGDTRKIWNKTLAQTDIPRLRAGKLGAQVHSFSMFLLSLVNTNDLKDSTPGTGMQNLNFSSEL